MYIYIYNITIIYIYIQYIQIYTVHIVIIQATCVFLQHLHIKPWGSQSAQLRALHVTAWTTTTINTTTINTTSTTTITRRIRRRRRSTPTGWWCHCWHTHKIPKCKKDVWCGTQPLNCIPRIYIYIFIHTPYGNTFWLIQANPHFNRFFIVQRAPQKQAQLRHVRHTLRDHLHWCPCVLFTCVWQSIVQTGV